MIRDAIVVLTFQVTETINGHYFFFLKSLFVVVLSLLVPLCSASAAYQASLAEPLFVFWRDVVEPKTLRHGKNMSLICSYVFNNKRYDEIFNVGRYFSGYGNLSGVPVM